MKNEKDLLAQEYDAKVAEYETRIASLIEEREKMAADVENFTQNFFPKEGGEASVDEESLKSLLQNDTITFFNIEGSGDDGSEAEYKFDFLGTWYVDEVCENYICVNISDLGLAETVIFNEDNSLEVNIQNADGTETYAVSYWQMEDDVLTVVDENDVAFTFVKLTDKGEMLLRNAKKGTLTLTREAPVPVAIGQVAEEIEKESFFGDWTLNGILAEGIYMPLKDFGIKKNLSIAEDTIVLDLYGKEPVELPYNYLDGVIMVEYEDSVLTIMARNNGMLELDPGSDTEDQFEYLFEKAE